MTDTAWQSPEPTLLRWLGEHRRAALAAYVADPTLVTEHGRQEDSFRTGGYASRQVLELIQNAADALGRSGLRGRVELRLTGGVLYCANQGEPFTQRGLDAVCHAYLSPKRGDEMGRFGLGFKSVLGITSRPTIFSSSISVGFDAAAARAELQAVVPNATAFPVLRLPLEVDVRQELASDAVLQELAQWATTVVRLPLDGQSERLAQDLRRFPKEFLLFAPSVETLAITVDDPVDAEGREGEGAFSVEHRCFPQSTARVSLSDGTGVTTDWLVWHRQHQHSAAALQEVGEALRREEVRVSYAVPLDDTATLGRFWAYFPLKDVTSTRGIHNAPWRINDDRTNLLDGEFNRELLDVLADMVVDALPNLSTEDDPARHFDYLPARGREAPNEADRYLAEVIPGKARLTPCVPNADGELQRPDDLVFPHSDLRLELEAHGFWDKSPGRPRESPHWTCYKTPTRRARLRSLVRRDDTVGSGNEVGAAAWLERIVPDATDAQVDAALRVLFAVKDENTRRDMLAAKILPDTSGSLHRLNSTKDVYLRGNVLSAAAGLQLVRSTLLGRDGVEERLRRLGFEDVDPRHELRKLANAAARKWGAKEWDGFWRLVEEVKVAEAQDILESHTSAGAPLKVRCRDGNWHDVGAVVVPGIVDPVDDGLALDVAYHELHLGLLQSIGVSARPVTSTALLHDLTFKEYLRLQRQAYLEALPPRGRPDATSLHFTSTVSQGPLHVLRRFQDTQDTVAQTAWTRELLEMPVPDRWQMAHSNHKSHPQPEVLAPHLWAAQTYGLLETSWGPRRAASALSFDLATYAPLLPVASDESSSRIQTITSLNQVPLDLWREFLARVPTDPDPWRLGELLAEACRRISTGCPATVPSRVGRDAALVRPTDLLLARDEEERRILERRAFPHVAVRDQSAVELLVDRWGCLPASSLLRVEIVSETPGEPIVLLDRFRGLRLVAQGHLDGLELVRCSDLTRQVTGPDGIDSEATDLARSDNTIFCVDTVSDEDLLAWLSDEFGLGLSAATLGRILVDAQDAQVKARVAACRAATTPGEKLLVLLPESTLMANLPAGLLDTVRALSDEASATQVADLLLHVHGYNVLNELRHALTAAGYEVPDRWAGSAPAVAFVRQLGFATEYAGAKGVALDSDVTVLGPPRLPSLHQYQAQLVEKIRELVRPGERPERALLFLPTGAGKTRVTVEALSRAFIDDGLAGPLLWIAQTEELCEQAVQTWSTIWREFGDRPLRVCRLWSANEVAQSEETLTVVVATDAKLDVIREREDYDWLRKPAAVVIDEAHTATGQGISETLEWLGIDNRRTGRPLLGLTATPFKGTGEETNRRLALRFGKRKFDVLGEDPYGELQRLGVLATVEHRVLDGAEVTLDAGERTQVETFGRIPQAVLERVGRDEVRTQRLLEDIESLPPDWPVLVFTASVLSAQTLAAVLRVRGIEAASVSGGSRMPDRRRSIDAFRRGEVRVLTNCAVLTQGFDAPAVRALYIARPTFSPNAYIQMVGRGLRGPANGGKERCLVVNVEDTFDQFGDKLAYKAFDYLWEQQGGRLR